jgi:hypothetical protein
MMTDGTYRIVSREFCLEHCPRVLAEYLESEVSFRD